MSEPLPVLLGQLIVVIATAAVCGRLFRRLGQPAVIGEMAAGLLLGPSVLGRLWPAAEELLFPQASLGTLGLLSQVGVLLFMFGVGLELDLLALKRRARTAVAVSWTGILFPLVLGIALGLLLHEAYAPSGIRVRDFVLFMGIAMSITAFPVLARILEERRLSRTPLGATVLAAAAVEDVTAWMILALVIALARAESPLAIVPIVALAAAFSLLMLFPVRKAAARFVRVPPGAEAPPRSLVALLLAGVFLAALATEAIGIHALFGAFLAGAILPKDRALHAFLRDRIEYSASLYLLPIFFAATGLRTELGLLDHPRDWLAFAAILAVAVTGKLGGVCVAARASGMAWRDAAALGALMNTRGLMELIVLNIGLDLGILSPQAFSMLVLMALVTTAMTGPLLARIGVGRAADPEAPRGELREVDRVR